MIKLGSHKNNMFYSRVGVGVGAGAGAGPKIRLRLQPKRAAPATVAKTEPKS